MATCPLCARRGLFLKLTGHRVCSACDPEVHVGVRRLVDQVRQGLTALAGQALPEKKLVMLDRAVAAAEAMSRYERAGVRTQVPNVAKTLLTLLKRRDHLLDRMAEEIAEKTAAKAQRSHHETRQYLLLSGLCAIKELSAQTTEKGLLDAHEQSLRRQAQTAQLAYFLKVGLAAERSGTRKAQKLALSTYREALYFLRHDDVDDALQKEHLDWLESRIAELTRLKAW